MTNHVILFLFITSYYSNNQGKVPWIISQCYCWKGGMAKLKLYWKSYHFTTVSVSYLT